MKEFARYDIVHFTTDREATFVIYRTEKGSPDADPVASAHITRRSTGLAFVETTPGMANLPTPENGHDMSMIEDLSFQALPKDNRIGSVIDAAYSWISMNEIRHYRKPSVETEGDQIVLYADSKSVNTERSAGGASGRQRPRRRRENVVQTWIRGDGL